jgi:hypothetical protein
MFYILNQYSVKHLPELLVQCSWCKEKILKCNTLGISGRPAYSRALIGRFLTWVPHACVFCAVLVRLNASGSLPLAQVWMVSSPPSVCRHPTIPSLRAIFFPMELLSDPLSFSPTRTTDSRLLGPDLVKSRLMLADPVAITHLPCTGLQLSHSSSAPSSLFGSRSTHADLGDRRVRATGSRGRRRPRAVRIRRRQCQGDPVSRYYSISWFASPFVLFAPILCFCISLLSLLVLWKLISFSTPVGQDFYSSRKEIFFS